MMRDEAGVRLDWPDVAKGICIISVILGHLGVSSINRVVFVYHLPVFFLLSGYFLKKKPDRVFAAGKAKRLLIPYGITCAAICLIGAFRAEDKGKEFMSWLGAALYGAGDSWQKPFEIRAIGAIWFLWALFWALLIVNHFIETKYDKLIILCIAFAGWASFDRTGIWLPLSIQAGMLASLYVLIGYEIRKNRLFCRLNVLALLGLILVSGWSIWNFKGFWLVHNYMGNGWLDFFTSICASIVIAYLSKFICDYVPMLTRALAWFGRNSLVILCFHIIELNVLPIGNYIGSRASEILGLSGTSTLLTVIAVKLLYALGTAWGFDMIFSISSGSKPG